MEDIEEYNDPYGDGSFDRNLRDLLKGFSSDRREYLRNDRPSLEQVFQACETAIAKMPDSFEESDIMLKRYVQQFVFNAPVEVPTRAASI